MSEQTVKETMQQAAQALDDWLNIYAEELCDRGRVALTRKRIEEGGGTLSYIAVITKNLRKAIEECEQDEKQEPVTPLYPHPAPKSKKLTDGEIADVVKRFQSTQNRYVPASVLESFARFVEAKVQCKQMQQ